MFKSIFTTIVFLLFMPNALAICKASDLGKLVGKSRISHEANVIGGGCKVKIEVSGKKFLVYTPRNTELCDHDNDNNRQFPLYRPRPGLYVFFFKGKMDGHTIRRCYRAKPINPHRFK